MHCKSFGYTPQEAAINTLKNYMNIAPELIKEHFLDNGKIHIANRTITKWHNGNKLRPDFVEDYFEALHRMFKKLGIDGETKSAA